MAKQLEVLILVLVAASALYAAEIEANSQNYRARLAGLKSGDTLKLAPGQYPLLPITRLNGMPEAWIRITGPATDPPAIIVGARGSNTVEITNSSYVAIENLRIDSRGIPGAFGISARGHEANLTHHIRIEGNTLVGQNGSQGTDGISTKTPTWGWVIRGNQILGAGTGLYLGDSDGSQPFVAGVIENNLIKDAIGYDMQIKDQIAIPPIPGMPIEPTTTIIRNNVFIKNNQFSPEGDRPNLLVGAFPAIGAGSLNMYEIYGNFFYHNHREALFQGSGRFSLHDNIFVDGPYSYPAVVIRGQNYPLKIANVYNNTVYTSGRGIYFGSRAIIDGSVVGNLVFAQTPISGMVTNQVGNITASFEDASMYVNAPSFELGAMDFYPKPGKCRGLALDLRSFQYDTDYTMDFNGAAKPAMEGAVVFRGAYAGDGTDPRWSLKDERKPVQPSNDPPSVLVWVDPPAGQAGTRTFVRLTGANFLGGVVVSISGVDATVEQVTVESPTSITMAVTLAAGAAAGQRGISVSRPVGKSNSLPFRVTARTAGTGKRQ